MFYQRLSYLCQRNGTNISKVSQEYLDVSNSTATGWKKGAAPRSDIVIKAARHFGVTSDFLLGLSDVESMPEQSDSLSDDALHLEPDELAMIEALRTASPTAKAAAVASFFSVLGVLQAKKDAATYSHSGGAMCENQDAI